MHSLSVTKNNLDKANTSSSMLNILFVKILVYMSHNTQTIKLLIDVLTMHEWVHIQQK